ncbi:GerMN domain-containing protein [Desnuesiella massiliensis]|uniref:GerMN domain-containing protein n=1 Tax=Desnuesiella massiliensis TaxID=1650662 RepID=UPI0006E189BD|nr:GerMN domain-containing protein [Desnuesiella massiliensis]
MIRKVNLYLCAVLCTTSMITSGCAKEDKISINNKERVKNIELPKEKDGYVDLDIYFDASPAENKVEIAKEEIFISKEEIIGEVIVNGLIKGPAINSKSKPVLPKDTRLLSFSIKDGIAFINLSKEAKVKMTATKEEACLKSIVTSLSQLSSISKVKIMIENQDTEVLGGNFNISKPFGKDDIATIKNKQ